MNLTTTVTFSFPDDKTFKVDFSTKVMSGKEEFKIGENNKHKSESILYLLVLIDLDFNLVLLSAATNQRPESMGILNYDWLPPKVRQD